MSQTAEMGPQQELLAALVSHGTASTGFLTLHGGFRHFKSEQSFLAYVDTPFAWVGASEPIGPPEQRLKTVQAFITAARSAKKVALILPVSAALAKDARAARIYAVQVGNEPWFTLGESCHPDSLGALGVARRIKRKGAQVEAFHPFHIAQDTRNELDDLVQSWLDHHALIPLSFLNHLAPWLHARDKRYFLLRYHGRIQGFIAAVPIPARQAWYLVDLIRSPGAPPGTTELLVIEAMESLRREGAREITLGMSPLAPVEEPEKTAHPWIYRSMDRVYQHSDSLYGFKSLFEYKQKFNPSAWEPQFLLASPGPGLRMAHGLVLAHFPEGLLVSGGKMVLKAITRWREDLASSRWFSDRLVLRSPPKNGVELLFRRKAVLALAASNVLLFLATIGKSGWHIRPSVEARFGFSFEKMVGKESVFDRLVELLVSSFLHANLLHLAFNLTLLLLFGGMLETVAGSTLVLRCYGFGMLLSNPLTSLILYGILRMAYPPASPVIDEFSRQIDIGCSLGVFACVGALAHFMKNTWIVIAALVACVALEAALKPDIMDLNHVLSLMIGLTCGQIYASKK